MRIPSRQRSQRGPSQASLDADATDTRSTQECVHPDVPRVTFSSSHLSSVDGDASPPGTPLHHDGRQHKQSPLRRGSPKGKGVDPGPLVWVRVTRSGKLAPANRGSSESEGSYWWPACVTEGRLTTGPLTVSLYGEISPSAPKSIRIQVPSPSDVLPFKWPGQDIIRFNPITFRCLETGPQRETFPKRPKTALDGAWRSAVDLAHEADAYLNDGLPSNLSSYRVETVRIHENKTEKLSSDAEAPSNVGRWSPPPCDPLLEIPGELVFSLAKRGTTEYWAARMEQYLPPKTPSMPPKYRVRFKDDTFCTVSRDMFYTSDEPKFYTCNLGRYVSDEEESDVDSDDEHVPYETGADEHAIPMPPPNPKDFCELSIRDQFAYVKPVIKAILNGTYLPARGRHEAFIKGGPSRLRLQKAATGKGDLTAREVSRLGRVLQQWVLGPVHLKNANIPQSSLGDLELETGLSTLTDDQVEQMLPLESPSPNGTSFSLQPSLTDVSRVPIVNTLRNIPSIRQTGPSEYPRQVGSPSYEALSESDKLQYCLLVLFHEATLQLLLWRSGERRSPELLSQDDEERLRLIGLAKSEERAWVEEISRLRKMKTRRTERSLPPRHATIDVSSKGRILRSSRNPPHVR